MKLRICLFLKHLPGFVISVCFFFLFVFLVPSNIPAQETTKRPSVGLVLSGGGAHGIAHLGVIKVMEEAGLRPDYITGVSMGSIIGGFYSAGYTSDSLYKLLKNMNWEQMLSNKIAENKVIFLEKKHFDNSVLSLPLSSRKFILPSGLINGQQIENELSYLLWPAADINDFSKLPIPFMCLGTDIITYKIAELKTGYLPDAIRASFAVPSVFTPLKIDTLLLVDGGLIRNFAASEAREMGSDIVIGSYVGFKGYKEEELQSVSGILKQIAMYRSLADFEEEKMLADLVIKPDVERFSVMVFDNVDSLFKSGYEAALPYKDYFRRLADSLNRFGPQKPVKNILDKQSYSFDKIEITGNKYYPDYQIRGILDIKPGEKIDKHEIKEKMELLYGKAWFDKVKYRIIPRNDSLILVIDCEEKPSQMFYGSVHYDNSLLSGINLEMSVKNLLTQKSVINVDTYISKFYRFDINYLQFIDRNQRFGLSANFYSDNTQFPMLELRGHRGDVSSLNFVPGVSINHIIGLNHMMSLSMDYENLNLILRYESDLRLKNLSYNYITTTYDYKVNSLDSKHFPDKGVLFNASISSSKLISAGTRTDTSKTVFKPSDHGEFSFDRFFSIKGSFKQYFSHGSKLTFALGGDVLFITDSDSISAQNNFSLLGGIESVNKRSVPMIGYHTNQIPVKKVMGIRSELDLELYKNLHLDIMADFFAIQQVNRITGYSFIKGYGIGLGYLSIIGPIKAGIEYGDYGQESYFSKTKGYISIGYNF
jgi:NTE family protein